MAKRRGHEDKTALTPSEKLRVTHAHLILGISQHDLAGLFMVNQGRIAEAISEIKKAIGWEEDT